jgi:MFS family permease
LVLFAHQQMYWLALVLAVPVGFGMMSQITISNTLIQTTVAPEMRGRVISFYAVAFFGMMPLGSLLMGWLAQRIGAQNTVLAEGTIGLLLGLWHLSYVKRMEKASLPKLAEEEAALV